MELKCKYRNCINTNYGIFTKKKKLEKISGLGKEFFHMTRKNITPKGKERTENWTSSRGNKGPSKNTCTPMFTEAPFTIAKTKEQAKWPLTEE